MDQPFPPHRIESAILPVPNKEQVPGLGTEPEVRKTAYNDDVTDDVRLLIRFSDGQIQKVENKILILVLPITNSDVIDDVIDDVM